MSAAEQVSPVAHKAIATPGSCVGGRVTNLESWKNLGGYLAAVVVVLAAMTATLRLWKADLRVPFHYNGDNLMNLMILQNMFESGWIYEGPRIGAPDGQEMYDFPLPDVLHLAVLKGMSCFSHDSGLLLNLFSLLGFPLATLSTYFVLRRFRLGRILSLIGAVLYACLPYHYARMFGHLFLAAYYLLPLMIWLLVRIYLGRHPLTQVDAEDTPRWRFWSVDAVATVLICLLTGLAGVYYAFFSCFFLAMVGVRSARRERRWTPLIVSTLLIAVISGAVGGALVPNLLYEGRHGKNPGVAIRPPTEADRFGLSISEMLLPIEGHRLRIFQSLRERFQSWPRILTGESWSVPLGLAASLGFIYLLARFLWRPRDGAERTADALAYMTLVAVLLGTIGGLGSCFNFYVTPSIRCYNRLTVFIAFFGLAGLLLLLQQAIHRYDRNVWTRILRYSGLIAFLALGILDQTSPKTALLNYAEAKQEYQSDADFGGRMEAVLPAGAMVYQMPYFPFPEAVHVQQLGDYELFRPYFHTRTLRFSYGAMRLRPTSDWLEAIAAFPLPKALELLALTGFRGVYLDRAGYTDSGLAEAELTRLLDVKPLVSLNGRQSFFDMTSYVNALHAQYGDSPWKAKTETATHPLRLEWAGACMKETAPNESTRLEYGNTWRWCGAKAQLTLRNTLNRPRQVTLKMIVASWQDKPSHLALNGDLCRRDVSLTATAQPLHLELIVPPGEHRLTFACDGRHLSSLSDFRDLVFRVGDLECHVDGE